MKGGERFPAITAMMTGTEIFCKAHEIARKTRAAYITYRAAFSAALKGVYAMRDHLKEKNMLRASKKKWTRPASPRPVLTGREMAAAALKVIPGGIAAFASMLAMIWIWLAL